METEDVRGSKTLLEILLPYVSYIGRRLLALVPTLLIITVIIFVLINSIPGDPIMSMINPEITAAMTIEERNDYIETMRQMIGYDRSMFERYFLWLKDTLIDAEFGYSIKYNKPVNEFIGIHIARSFRVNIFGFLIAFFISIPVGITAAINKNKLYDKFVTVGTVVGISLPAFFISLLLILLFVVEWRILPFSGMSDPRGIRPDWHYLVLPVTVVVLTSLAGLVRYVRAAMIEVLQADYIRTARAKGLAEKIVIYRHAFQNALIPVVTLIGLYIPLLFGGSIVVEKIFAYQGMGFLLNAAYGSKDRAILQTAILFFGLLTLLGNVFIDIGYMIVDPRIREGKLK